MERLTHIDRKWMKIIGVLIALLIVVVWAEWGLSAEVKIGGNGSAAVDSVVVKDQHIGSNQVATHYDTLTGATVNTLAILGDNFREDYMLVYFPTLADSVPAGEKADSARLGWVVGIESASSRNGSDSLDVVVRRLLRDWHTTRDSANWINYNGVANAWTTAGANGVGTDIASTDYGGQWLVDSGGVGQGKTGWFNAIDTADYQVGDTIYISVDTAYINGVDRGDFVDHGLRISFTDASYDLELRWRKSIAGTAGSEKMFLKMWTSAVSGGGSNAKKVVGKAKLGKVKM